MLVDGLDSLAADVYNGMLTRFRFSRVCNEHVTRNYESMLGGLQKIGYHTACAFLDCKQFEQHTVDSFSASQGQLFMAKIHRLMDVNLYSLIPKCTAISASAPKLLRRLVKANVNDSYIQIVWDIVCNSSRDYSTESLACSSPLDALKSFVFKQAGSIQDVQSLVSTQIICEGALAELSQEARAFYTAVFWEAPEMVIAHFLDQVPGGCKVRYAEIEELLYLPRYSDLFCKRLIARAEKMGSEEQSELCEFRPELICVVSGTM